MKYVEYVTCVVGMLGQQLPTKLPSYFICTTQQSTNLI